MSGASKTSVSCPAIWGMSSAGPLLPRNLSPQLGAGSYGILGGYIGVEYWGYIGVMEKQMEVTVVY